MSNFDLDPRDQERLMRAKAEKEQGAFAAGVSFACAIAFLFFPSWITGLVLAFSVYLYLKARDAGG